MTDVTVRKLDHLGRETWRYPGVVLERGPTWVLLEAYFNRDDDDAGYVVFRRGDRFVEWYSSEHWYNIFEVHDVSDDHLKGWYCNLSRPAHLNLEAHEISSDDLALDMWVDSAGRTSILDEIDFESLPIDEATRARVWHAVDELRAHVERRDPPFDRITAA